MFSTIIMLVENHAHIRHIMLYHFENIRLQKLFVILTSCLAKEQLVKDKSEDGSNASNQAIHHWRMKEEEVGHRILMIKLYWMPWKKMKVSLPDYWLRCLMSTNQLRLRTLASPPAESTCCQANGKQLLKWMENMLRNNYLSLLLCFLLLFFLNKH